MKCRKWVLRSRFSGLPKREDLEIVEEELPPVKDGGTLTRLAPSLQIMHGTCLGVVMWSWIERCGLGWWVLIRKPLVGTPPSKIILD